MLTETRTRLRFRRQVNELGVGMSLAEAMPPRVKDRIRRMSRKLRREERSVHDDTLRARALGAWLSKTFDYDEPPTLAEMLDAHPLFRSVSAMESVVLTAMGAGYITAKDSDEGTVYIPGPGLR